MPNVEPLPMMLAQRLVIEANSAGLSVPVRNGVSVVANTPAPTPGCTVVPNASMPAAGG